MPTPEQMVAAAKVEDVLQDALKNSRESILDLNIAYGQIICYRKAGEKIVVSIGGNTEQIFDSLCALIECLIVERGELFSAALVAVSESLANGASPVAPIFNVELKKEFNNEEG